MILNKVLQRERLAVAGVDRLHVQLANLFDAGIKVARRKSGTGLTIIFLSF
jgi:hypothetical protein